MEYLEKGELDWVFGVEGKGKQEMVCLVGIEIFIFFVNVDFVFLFSVNEKVVYEMKMEIVFCEESLLKENVLEEIKILMDKKEVVIVIEIKFVVGE